MNPYHLKAAIVCATAMLSTQLSPAQTSELYMLSSPNVIYPVGTTYVYQGGQQLRSWTHAGPYEIPLAVVGGTVRQGAVFSGFSGTEYSTAGALTGTHYAAAPNVYDAASDGTSIYGWDVISASLLRYDLNWSHPQSLFSLGASYSYLYMGITYDPQNGSIWLAAWNNSNAGHLYNYSLTGTLLGNITLAGGAELGSGLAYDAADNTFWMFDARADRLDQYSRNGDLLSTITERSRVYGLEFAAVPEPATMTLVAVAALWSVVRRAKTSRQDSQSK